MLLLKILGLKSWVKNIECEASVARELHRNLLGSYNLNMKDFSERITKLEDKIEIQENEIKTQDDIIFDMRKKIEKLEKQSWKGKKK